MQRDTDDMNRSRRGVLAGLGATAAVGLAGCLTGTPGRVRPNGTPTSIPDALVCDRAGFDRHAPFYAAEEVSWGQANGFRLRVNQQSFELGATAQLSLQRTGVSPTVIGNRDKYNLEVRTAAGWQDVRVANDSLVYTDMGFEKWPGQGWTWNIDLTEAGIAAATDTDVTVCPELPAGRYRFVYWGIDDAVAVAFDLTR